MTTGVNDTIATAEPHLLNGNNVYVFGDHLAVDDVDVYAITVPTGARIRAEIVEGDRVAETCESNGVDSLLTLFDQAGVQLVDDDDEGRAHLLADRWHRRDARSPGGAQQHRQPADLLPHGAALDLGGGRRSGRSSTGSRSSCAEPAGQRLQAPGSPSASAASSDSSSHGSAASWNAAHAGEGSPIWNASQTIRRCERRIERDVVQERRDVRQRVERPERDDAAPQVEQPRAAGDVGEARAEERPVRVHRRRRTPEYGGRACWPSRSSARSRWRMLGADVARRETSANVSAAP